MNQATVGLDEVTVGASSYRLLTSIDGFGKPEEHDRLFMAKFPEAVERLNTILAGEDIRTIFEIGILRGGSTAYLVDLLQPDRLVAIDLGKPAAKLESWIDEQSMRDRVRTFYGVDQADKKAIDVIYEAEFYDRLIDLVIDDASHELESTRTSFNILFPRVRTGGLYIIEDWACSDQARGFEALLGEHLLGKPPLSLLIKDIIVACARAKHLIADVLVTDTYAVVRRGTGPMPAQFEIRDFI